MVTLTYDATGAMKVYTDTDLGVTSTIAPGLLPDTDSATLNIGAAIVGTIPVEFVGLIDEVSIFSYPLSEAEIIALYTSATGESLCVDDPGDADVTGDCKIDIADFALIAAQWMEDGNMYPTP